MVGRILVSRQRGRGSLEVEDLGGLRVLTGVVHLPPGLSPRRRHRRLERLERQMWKAGVGRVILPEGQVLTEGLSRLRPVDVLPFYRGVADVLALGVLDGLGVEREQGRVVLSAPWLRPELRLAAQRLCLQIRAVGIHVPGEGARFAQWMQRQYGLPVIPPEAPAHVTVDFGQKALRRGKVLGLYEPPDLGGWKVRAKGLELPEDCEQTVLALLWEIGVVRREELRVVRGQA